MYFLCYCCLCTTQRLLEYVHVIEFNINEKQFIFCAQLPGLTKETSLALSQTCQSITGLSKYLMNECGFKYVLLGQIQFDTIEGRFGHIDLLSGANYFILMRQLYESD